MLIWANYVLVAFAGTFFSDACVECAIAFNVWYVKQQAMWNLNLVVTITTWWYNMLQCAA